MDDSHFIPLWIQPGLIPRSQDRRQVQRVAYAGQVFNGNLAGNVEAWRSAFARHAIEFDILRPGKCFDLSEVDVLVGIRSFDQRGHDTKPASKLINAWHANIPFIGGHDSAFKQVGVPGKDYLLVDSQEDVVNMVLKLRDDSELYSGLVNKGAEKALVYTNEEIAQSWEDILTGPVVKRFSEWRTRPTYEKVRFKCHRTVNVVLSHGKRIAERLLRLMLPNR